VIDRMIATADSIARVTGTAPTGMRARVSVDRPGPLPRHP
jgi:hypothetical protein